MAFEMQYTRHVRHKDVTLNMFTMKNTLIAAFVLSGSSLYAATSDVTILTSSDSAPLTLGAVDATVGGSTSITSSNNVISFTAEDGSTSLSSYAITIRLDNLSSPNSPVLSYDQSGGSAKGLGIYLSSAADSCTAKFNDGSSSWSGSGSLVVSQGDTLTFVRVADGDSGSDGMCYIVNQTTKQFISASSSDGYKYSNGNDPMSLISGQARLWTNGGKAQMSLLGVTDLSDYSLEGGSTTTKLEALSIGGVYVLVPEPATATLSLMALAGLAVRRRRK